MARSRSSAVLTSSLASISALRAVGAALGEILAARLVLRLVGLVQRVLVLGLGELGRSCSSRARSFSAACRAEVMAASSRAASSRAARAAPASRPSRPETSAAAASASCLRASVCATDCRASSSASAATASWRAASSHRSSASARPAAASSAAARISSRLCGRAPPPCAQ